MLLQVVLELDPERFASMVREARRRGVTGAPVLENGMIAGEGKGPLTSQGDSIPKVVDRRRMPTECFSSLVEPRAS